MGARGLLVPFVSEDSHSAFLCLFFLYVNSRKRAFVCGQMSTPVVGWDGVRTLFAVTCSHLHQGPLLGVLLLKLHGGAFTERRLSCRNPLMVIARTSGVLGEALHWVALKTVFQQPIPQNRLYILKEESHSCLPCHPSYSRKCTFLSFCP